MVTAKRVDCPAPLPEDTATALLTDMLFPAPYEVLEKKGKKKATRTRKEFPAPGDIRLIVR